MFSKEACLTVPGYEKVFGFANVHSGDSMWPAQEQQSRVAWRVV